MSTTHDLTHCTHPAPIKVVTGQVARWCGRCGAIHNGHAWERPSMHRELRKARPVHHRTTHHAPAKRSKRAKKARKGKRLWGAALAAHLAAKRRRAR